MTRVYDGETVLKNLLWDVDRMIREKQEPKKILKHIENKIEWLKNPDWYKVEWWKKE